MTAEWLLPSFGCIFMIVLLVDVCDGSVLLDDIEDVKGEKNALPNRNSLLGFEVIDNIKADVERFCPFTVSRVDILTLAAREAIVLSGGPYWDVQLGRRDGTTASEIAAKEQIPSPFDPLENIIAKFTSKGLDLKDVVVLSVYQQRFGLTLYAMQKRCRTFHGDYDVPDINNFLASVDSGGHTIGYAQCSNFQRRLFDFQGSGMPDPTLDSSLLSNLQGVCPNEDNSNTNLAPLDTASSYEFDNAYYTNLISNTGLLESDQALIEDPKTAAMVNYYSMNPADIFSYDFAASMTKLGNVGILTGKNGQIRKTCGSVN